MRQTTSNPFSFHNSLWTFLVSRISMFTTTSSTNANSSNSSNANSANSSNTNTINYNTTPHMTSYHLTHPNKNLLLNLISLFRHYIYSNDQTKYLFYFIVINILFMILELIFGIYNNSLGLISDSAHMFFDCTALIIGLYGSIMSKWKSNQIYSYGYVRYEYLSGFINGILLVFISIYILIESVHRLIDPPIVHTQQLLLVSIMGFAVNMYGVIFYHQDHHSQHHHHHEEEDDEEESLIWNEDGDEKIHDVSSCHHHSQHHHSHHHQLQQHHHSHHHHDENLYGVYLHMIADALGSIGVITSTLIVQYFGWYIADPICSLIISVMILYTSIPLITNSSRVLLQRTPIQYEHKINECVKEILQLEGVVQVRNLHFWVLKSNLNVGSCKVMITNQSNEQTILKQVTDIFRNYRCDLDMTIEVEKDPLQVMSSHSNVHSVHQQ